MDRLNIRSNPCGYGRRGRGGEVLYCLTNVDLPNESTKNSNQSVETVSVTSSVFEDIIFIDRHLENGQ